MGPAAKWGKCGGYYGEDIEWEGLGSCELLCSLGGEVISSRI